MTVRVVLGRRLPIGKQGYVLDKAEWIASPTCILPAA